MLAIEMIGGVYCPLSPEDPQNRLHALVQHTQSRFILVDHLTKVKFGHGTMLVNIDSLLMNTNTINDNNMDTLSRIMISSENVAYIIFTSGSTGTPKAVRQNNFHQIQTKIRDPFLGSSDTS